MSPIKENRPKRQCCVCQALLLLKRMAGLGGASLRNHHQLQRGAFECVAEGVVAWCQHGLATGERLVGDMRELALADLDAGLAVVRQRGRQRVPAAGVARQQRAQVHIRALLRQALPDMGEGLLAAVAHAQPHLGAALRIKQFSCTVVGILAAKGQGGMGDQDDTVLLPLHTLQRRVTGNHKVNTLQVSMQKNADSGPLKASLRQLLRERRKLAGGDDDNFNIFDTQQLAETLSSTMGVLTNLLGAVAAVSLLVGGIGIMNIMLVSVTERTREIGLRLAVGALEGEVLLQFLIEAVVLSALGGVVGVLIATGASYGLSLYMAVPYEFDAAINVLAMVFSAGIGVVFGYFPARRAARMDPIEALRHE